MSQIINRVKDRFKGTGVGTNAGVTVTQAAPSNGNDCYCVTGIQCSGDAAAVVTIESPAATILYRKRFAAAFNMSETFEAGVMKGAAGQAILVKVSASTANSEANIQGFRS